MVRTTGFQSVNGSSILPYGTKMAYVYTEKEFDEIKAMYANGQTLETIQSLFPDKSVASIRMKLVKAGLYTPATKTTTTKASGSAVVRLEPFAFPTTKPGIASLFKSCLDKVGPALL